MKSYQVVLTDQADGPVEWREAREVRTPSHRDAALLAFTLLPRPNPLIGVFVRGGLVRAWVWESDGPKHDTGAPICVHGLDLQRGPAATA